MAATIPSELQRDAILSYALTAFMEDLLPLEAFSTSFRDAPLEGTNKMEIEYYPLHTVASKDFVPATGYEMDDGVQSFKEITIDKRKYQSLELSSEELARQPKLNPQKLGTMIGHKLAVDVLADILSVVTVANFGAAASNVAASAFDFEELNEVLGGVADAAHWPKRLRNCVLGSAKYRNLGTELKNANESGTQSILTDAMLPRLAGFNMFSSEVVPANGESLDGFICYNSAVLVGFAPIQPAPGVRKNLIAYERASAAPGLTLEYRKWGDPDLDRDRETIEVNYGFAVGEGAALKRVTSP